MARIAKKISLKVKDALCGFSTDIIVRKPDPYYPETGTFVCSGCESLMEYSVTRPRGLLKGQVNIVAKHLKMSPVLEELLLEQKREQEQAAHEANSNPS